MIYIAFGIVAVLLVASFLISWQERTASSFVLCGTMATLFVVLFLSTHPVQNKITTPNLSIEPRLNQIETTQVELKQIVTTLVKLQYLSTHGSITFGRTQEHNRLQQEYIQSLKPYLEDGFEATMTRELKQIETKDR